MNVALMNELFWHEMALRNVASRARDKSWEEGGEEMELENQKAWVKIAALIKRRYPPELCERIARAKREAR